MPAASADRGNNIIGGPRKNHAVRNNLVDTAVGRVQRPAKAISPNLTGQRMAQFIDRALSFER
jgi:hypothetical protein